MAEKQLYSGQKPVDPQHHVFNYLSNGSTVNAVGDYSDIGAGADDFRITCKDGSQKLHLARLIVYWEDVGTAKSGFYGVDVVLTNGIEIVVRDRNDVELEHLTDDAAITTNAQWSGLCHDVTIDRYGTGSNGSLSARWTFANSGAPLSLSAGDYLSVALNDDFTGLEVHTFMVQGYYS